MLPEQEAVDDAALIAQLRDGDVDAYEELWRRHIGPALRLAGRLSPHQPEDLAAEAFTSVLHQITVAGGGPDQNFRAYLFTVMRNLAIRWNRDGRRKLPLADVDDPVIDAGTERVIADEDSRIVLQAFRTLPVRWQQVLWLAEVEDEPRAAIAARFTMSPNSVSALLRRARQGLRHQCLVEHVPDELRTDRSHVARALPDLLCGKLAPDTVVKLGAHLAGCATCREVHSDLRSLSWRVKRATLGTLGFGALTFFVKDLGAAGVAAAATGVVGTAVGGLAIGGPISTAVKVAAVTVGVAVIVVPVTGGVIWPSAEDLPAAAAVLPTQPSSPEPTGPSRPGTVEPTSRPQPTPTTTPSSTPGTVIEVDAIELWQPASPAPARPTPTPIDPGTLPGPAQPVSPGPAEPATPSTPAITDGETGSPQTGSSATPSPGTSVPGSPTEPASGGTPTAAAVPPAPVVAAVGTAAGYIAPLLSGAVAPLATVAIQITPTGPTPAAASTAVTYAVTADADGAWNFDLSSLGLTADHYRAIVWQVVAQASSPATELDFSTSAPRVDGLPEAATLYDVDAEIDGIVITIVAPGQQQACLRASTGQEATIALAVDGTASRRVRFQGLGTFELEVAICQDGRYGSPTRSTITIVEKFFTPWPVELEPAVFVEEL